MIRNGHHTQYRNRRLGDATSALIGGGIGAGVSLAVAGVNDWLQSIQQSHSQDTGATVIANEFAQQMGNLDAAYLAEVSPTCADQRAALDAFDAAWAWVSGPTGCGQAALGSAGQRCISERKPGGIYDATAANRNPIANDPRMIGQGCDTSVQLFLPNASTGLLQPTGLTVGGGSSSTGQTAAQLAAAAVTAAATQSAGSVVTTPAGTTTLIPQASATASFALSPTMIVYAGLGLAALLLLGGSE
jgi:hypothetical protein